MASPKFRSGETFSKNVLIIVVKDFCKILKRLFKNLHKNLKILQNFSNLKFNKIYENLLKFKNLTKCVIIKKQTFKKILHFLDNLIKFDKI